MFNVQKIYIFCKALIGCRLPTVQKSKCDINYTYLDKIADLGVFGFLFLKVLKSFFLYEDRTRNYDPKAHEKHSIHGRPTPYLTKEKSPVSEGEEHHVKNKMKLMNLSYHN